MIKEYLDENEFYFIKDEIKFCCDEQQFVHVCKAHGETMGCYFCEFDYNENCECESVRTCFNCYGEGVIGWANGEDFDTEFCLCSAGVKLENEYGLWYSESIMNENYKENA